MVARTGLAPKDRQARSRLIQLLAAARPLARAGLVTMSRRCGKQGCKCRQGPKHVSLYLAARVGRERKMIYVPRKLEDIVRSMVEGARKADQLLEEMSEASIERFLDQKAGRERESRS